MAKSATHQSTTKSQTLSTEDRISDLPQSLLCHILSFLPTKEAVATSILSCSWKLLWTLIPKLDLDSETINPSPDDELGIRFAHIVSRVLAQQQQCREEGETSQLRILRLKGYFGWDGSYLDAWLRTAAARKVKELDLEVEMNNIDEEALKLPPSLFSCRTLVVLKLSGNIDIDFDTLSLSFQFPSLKIVDLEDISIAISSTIIRSHEHSSLSLLSGCPVLEDLSLKIEYFEGKYKICIPKLKSLTIGGWEFNDFDFELEINAPALEYFLFEGDPGHIKIHEKLDNLVESDVYISKFEGEHEECFRERESKLFAALYNVEFLSFSPFGTEWHDIANIYRSSFPNLVQLRFKVEDCNWHVLQELLQKAPILETLVVTKVCCHQVNDFVPCNLCWKEPQYDPDYLSSRLTSFYYRRFKGLEHEVKFIKYILKEARLLETATIQVLDGESKETVLEKLSMFPRRSTTCLLTVE